MNVRRLLRLPPPDPPLARGGLLVLASVSLFLAAVSLPAALGCADALRRAGSSGQALLQAAAFGLAALPILAGAAASRGGLAALGAPIERLGSGALLGGAAIWLAGLLLWLPLFGLYAALLQALGIPNEPQPIYQELARDLARGRPDPVLIVLVCLVLPLGEELFFRGALQGMLRGYLSRSGAIGTAAGLFALLHGPWTVVFPVFLLGLLFGYARERTGSIWGAWAAHALHNSAAVALAPYMIQLYDRIEPALSLAAAAPA